MITPWYKQFWPWFLIALPASVVIGSFVTLGLFSKNAVSLVAEDYYKKGKGINIDLSKINAAKELELGAMVLSKQNSVIVQFDKGELTHFPALIVYFTHRTLPDRDFQKTLSADGQGNYQFSLPNKISGPWFIELEPHNQQWLIQGKVEFPSESPTALMK
ncbi:FixH family protein [Vibrio tapetis]|uniref:Putative analog of CcoH n=1 Tax=Vibrio tapetis subsp. tapetis TaxID=1671868 RepID=A0A2N8Z9Q5_9VIBR|nr:FixH family protein [Vibrio tapetis]SON48630.1 putative analog of CcoH [Vibrio tapetis subsp. tapetis]